MTREASHGAPTRERVYIGKQKVAGLTSRTLADGSEVFEYRGRLAGRVRTVKLTARTKTDAVTELRALQVDAERGELHRSPAAALTFADVAADFLQHIESRVGHRDPKRRYSARTVALYRQRLRSHILPALGTRPMAELTVADVRRLVDTLGRKLAPATVTGMLNIVSAVCGFAIKNGAAERNVVRDLQRDDRPGTKRLTEPRWLTRQEIDAVQGKLSDTFRPVAVACTFAGLRVSEALGLRWRDVGFTASTLTISGQLGERGVRVPTKTESSATTIPLVPALARELRAHKARQAECDLRLVHADALVFVTNTGKAQSRRNALRAVHVAGDAVGLNGDGREPVGLHDLRDSFVALAFEAGLSLPEVSALARHADPRVTAMLYAGLVDGGLEQASAKLVKAGFGA